MVLCKPLEFIPGAKTIKKKHKLTVLNNTKLRHFWAQIVSWAPRHARKTFIVLAPGICCQLPLLLGSPSPCAGRPASRFPGGVHFRATWDSLLLLMQRTCPSHLHLTRFTSLTMLLMLVHLAISTLVTLLPAYLKNTSYGSSEFSSFSRVQSTRGEEVNGRCTLFKMLIVMHCIFIPGR